MTRRLMLDSGAFAVWSQGHALDLKEYIAFCHAHPETTYFIALDVIPGSRGGHPGAADIDDACRASWANYRSMCGELPRAKVIPVFHGRDPIKWLHKYLDAGVDYLALGGVAMSNAADRYDFLRRIRPAVESSGVKLHGLGITSFDLMKYWEWESVDSTSWKHIAAWGWIYVPRKTRGEYDFSKEPHVVGASAMKKGAMVKQGHFQTMSPSVRAAAMEYLEFEGLRMGEWRVEQVTADYSIPRNSEEFWYDKRRRLLLRTVVKGVATSFEERCKATHAFMRRANAALPVRHVYYAGAPLPYPLETRMGSRLLSYFDLRKKSGHAMMKRHTETMGRRAGA